MARFADFVRLRGVGKPISDDRGWPNRTGIEKGQHSLEMGTVANDVGAQRLDIVTGRMKSLRRWCDPHEFAAGL